MIQEPVKKFVSKQDKKGKIVITQEKKQKFDNFLPVSQIPDFDSSQSSNKSQIDQEQQEMIDEFGSSSESKNEEEDLDVADLEDFLQESQATDPKMINLLSQ